MNEELIRQCARDTLEWFSWPTNTTAGKVQAAAEDAIRLYHARAVAPLERENAELRALVKDLTAQAKADGERIGRLEASVAPLVEAAEKIAAINLATDQVPHEFGWWVLQLRAALAPFQQAVPSAPPQPSPDVARLVEAMREITEGAQTTFRARNGRQCSIEADDGEACLIVHSDLIHEGKQALAPFQQEGSQ